MDAKDLLNWGELSRMLSGSRQTVRKNKIPKIHEPFINDLTKAMDKVISKRFEKPERAGQKNNKITPSDDDSEQVT